MKKNDDEKTKLKINQEQKDNSNNQDENDERAKLNEDSQYQYFLSHFNQMKPKLNPELKTIKQNILRYGSDIIDEDDPKKYADRPVLEKYGHKVYNIAIIFEHYFHAFLSIVIAIYIIYYTNLFYNLYFNPKINRLYLYFSAFLFIVDTIIFMYINLYLYYIKKLDDKEVEKELDDFIPYCTGIGIVAFLFLIFSMWSVYRYYSIPIVLSIFWGIVMSANFFQKGFLGNIFFVAIITLMLFSYKFIPGTGKTYY